MKTLIYFLLLSLSLMSCDKQPIEKYCSGIIIDKYKNNSHSSTWIDIKYNGNIINNIYLYNVDYDKYEIGDTIKCSTADSILYRKDL